MGNGDGADFVNEQTSGNLSLYGLTIAAPVVRRRRRYRPGWHRLLFGCSTCFGNSLYFQSAAPFVDSSDNVYFSDNEKGPGAGCAWVLPAQSGNIDGMNVTAGNVYKLAGNGGTTATSDGTSGVTSNVAGTSSMTVDPAGNVVLGVSGSGTGTSPALRVLAESTCSSSCPYGLASTTAGDLYTAAVGSSPGPATLTGPTSVLSDGTGNLLFTDGATSSANLDELSGGPAAVPVVTSVSPNAGPLAGGTSVTITSSVPNFTGATAVHFGPNMATPTVVSPSEITTTSPAGTGTVDVTVTTPAGTSAITSADSFTYVPAPTVTASARRRGRLPAGRA